MADVSLTDEICELLVTVARSRPIVLVIEDLEYADQASWDVCERLATRIGDSRVLLCLTGDGSFASASRARFGTLRRHYEVRLGTLAPDEVQQWVGDLFADRATADACATHLAQGGAFTPLLAAHTLHALADRRVLVHVDGTWRAVDTADLSSAPESTASDVLARRLDLLSPKTRAILGELAVLGEGFEVDVALAAGMGDEAELLDAIDEALAAALLCDDGAEPGSAFAFTHREVARAARATVDPMRLRRVHERIARGLEQVRPVALFEIAEHFDRSGMADRAFEYALLAAARAVSVQAFGDAVMAYERARAHVTTPAQRRRLDELVAELPIRPSSAGVA